MSKYKTKQRFMAMILSVIIVVGMMPASALAETGILPIGASGEITAFEALGLDIAVRSVPVGIPQTDLKLPDTLTATVRFAALEEEQVIDSGEADADSRPDSADMVSDSAISVFETDDIETGGNETDEIASPSDAEEAGDGMAQLTVPLPVTWLSSPEYDGETAGTYIFMPELPKDLTLADGVEAPQITVTVGTAAITGMVTAFGALPDDIRWQNTTAPEFPETIGGTVESESVQIPVTWEADHDYDAEYPQRGLYVFTAVLGEGYALADSAELPRMTVYIPQTVGGRMARMAGAGTSTSPLEITTAAQLAEIATLVNVRMNGLELFLFNNTDAKVSLELRNGIDLSAYSGGEGWTPIGTGDNPFTGIFEGYGNHITGLYINRSSTSYQGLFGCVGSGGTVRNLGIVETSITGNDYVGGVAGFVSGMIQNCYVTGSVSGNNDVGGVAGAVLNGGTAVNCYSTGAISGSSYVGGVAGVVYGVVENCYSTGAISGGMFVGGMAGEVLFSGTVQNCAALNLSVSGTHSRVGRVAWHIDSGNLSGNIAFGGMTVTQDGSTKDLEEGADKVDGASKTAAEIKTAGFFEALFAVNTAWTYTQGKLPVLTGLPGQSDALPPYIAGLEGAGTSESDPYRIYTAEDLKWLADQVNGITGFAYGKFFRLENDIDLSAYGKDYDVRKGWTPIGSVSTFENAVFNGNGKTITGLYINRSNETNIGLFGSVTHGTIQNLFLKDITLHSNTNLSECNVGGLAGRVIGSSTISGCAVTGSVSGEGAERWFVGGLVGNLREGSTVNNCAFYGTVSAKNPDIPSSPSSAYAGGIAGKVYYGAAITNCLGIATVEGAGSSAYIGGIAGQVDTSARITQSAALGARISSSDNAGRIVIIGYVSAANMNYAWSGMTVNSTTVSGLTYENHGADTDASALQTLWTIGPLSTWDSSVWTLAAGKLPVLKNLSGQSDALPAYIKGLEGAGTSESDPYNIYTAEDLKWLADKVNRGDGFGGKYFRLENDIDLSAYGKDYDGGKGWTPIGKDSSNSFKGTFDGNKKTITGLTINRPEADNIGLFGYLFPNSTVKNLSIADASVTGKLYVGGIAGYAWGTAVENCSVSGSIFGAERVGGIAGYASGSTIQNCYSTGSVTGASDYTGGVVGYLSDNTIMLQRCYSNANVTGEQYVGGVAGFVYSGTIQNCYSTGKITGVGCVGGVAGDVSSGTVQNCYSSGSVLGTDSYVGGVSGFLSNGIVKNCAALSPSIDTGTYHFGRVVGSDVSGTLLNNYAFSRIPGTWANKGSSAKDGADVTSQTLFGGNFWTMATYWDTAAWDGSVWMCEGDKLPILFGLGEQSGDGGLYLTARDIQYATVDTVGTLTYNGSEQVPTITFDGETLTKDTDYTVTITSTDSNGTSAGTNAGEVTLTITGIGSFYGTKNLTYTIDKKSVTITPNPGQSKIYGAADPVLTYTASPALSGGAFTGALSRAAGDDVGTYAISLGDLSAGSNYELSLASGTVNFTIERAKVTGITITVDDVNISAHEVRTATTAQAVVDSAGLPSSVSVTTDGGTATLPITWGTSTIYNAKGAEYAVTGTLTGNSNVDTNGVTKSVTITIAPVTAVNPTFSDTLSVINSDTSATADELGGTILPTSGNITIEGVSVAYTINWNGGETLNRTSVGNEQTFTGTIIYAAPPAWLTLPSDLTVSRKVTVTDKTLVTIGGITTTNKAYDGTAYVPTGTVTCSHGFPINQLEWLYESADGSGYSSSTAPTNAGAYKLTISVPESNSNYAGSEIFTFTIGKRQITLAADNKTVIKGGGLPTLTYTASNLALGETVADALSIEPALACSTFDGNTPGNYGITIIGGTATDNYTITIRTGGTLTVAEQTYTVTFNLNGGTHTGGGELTQTVAEGNAATAPIVIRIGYTFIGWDKGFDNVTSNLTVTANWSYNGGSSGGSSDSGGTGIIVTPPAQDQPNAPTQGEIKVDGTVDANGNLAVNIAVQTVTNAYEKTLADAKKNGNEQNGITLVLKVSSGNQTANSVTFNLPKAVQNFILAKKIVNTVVVVDNPGITISMDLAAVKEINRQANADVNITATRMDNGKLTGSAKSAIGSRPVFDLKVNYSGGNAIQNFGAGSVSVTIPYTLGANEKSDSVQAVYVDVNGKVQWLISSVYDNLNNVLRFSASHFSIYGVGYKHDAPTFTDIGTHWAKDDIAFVVNRGLFSGTSKTAFSPNIAMTRGMFITVLGRLANADVSAYEQSSFIDVKNDAYYMGYIEWASKNNIVSGVGDSKFAPDQSVTHEQMAVIMSNYAKTIGFDLPKVHVENIFVDNAKISAYAKVAVKQMQMAGIISGKNGNLFGPQGTATRAEVSAVLRRFVELAISSDTAHGWTMNDFGKWMYYENGKPVTGKKDIDGSAYTFDQYGVTADVPKNLRYTTYIVKKGDSYWLIAYKLGCTMSELERLNNKSRFDLIHPSDVLRVPERME